MEDRKAVALKCCVQTYAWGKPGSQSTVAKLAQNDSSFNVDETTTYAEYWMGMHPKGPSMINGINCTKQISLEEWLKKHPQYLGSEVLDQFGPVLPFLFKVLSVNKGLSIQAHPTKKLAAELHQKNPQNYPDDNHKPEMAIALTEFHGLCGFRPYREVADFLIKIPELKSVVGVDESSSFITACNDSNDEELKKSLFKKCFTSLMKKDPNIVKDSLSSLITRINDTIDSSVDLKDLLLKLNKQFPGDVGCFCIYFLNHMVLKPGESMFLSPNLPHAYLDGDCIECMACSDNTVRAGLTPKFRDVDTLCDMLDYSSGSAQDNLFDGIQDPVCPYTVLYDPPVSDFAVRKIQVPSDEECYNLTALKGPSIIIVIEGSGWFEKSDFNDKIIISNGMTIFCATGHSLTLKKEHCKLLMFQAYCDGI